MLVRFVVMEVINSLAWKMYVSTPVAMAALTDEELSVRSTVWKYLVSAETPRSYFLI